MCAMKWQGRDREFDPKQPVEDLEQALEQLLDAIVQREEGMGHSLSLEPDALGAGPALDLYAQEGGYRLIAELPGVAPESVKVTASARIVAIAGRWVAPGGEQPPGEPLIAELRRGAFRRVVALPGEVDGSRVRAQLEEGVLTLTLPLAEEPVESAVEVEIG